MKKEQKTLMLPSIAALLTVFLLSACNEIDSPAEKTTDPVPDAVITPEPKADKELTLSFQKEDGNTATITVELPDDNDVFKSSVTVTVPSPTAQKQLEEENSLVILPPSRINKYKTLSPHPELFCDAAQNEDFSKIAKQLGGYKKGSQIYIEPDAATPKILDGIEPFRYELAEAATKSDGASGVNIQRPNTLVRQGDQAFYLSDIYGLIRLDVGDATAIKLSCALPLPGRPLNFVITEDSLIVLMQSINGQHSGIIKLSINKSDVVDGDNIVAPLYDDALFFKDQAIIDARLFNQVLALYVKKYREREEESNPISSSDVSTGSALSLSRGYVANIVENHQLHVVTTNPGLELQYTEVFNSQDENIREDDSTDRWSNYFNNFLSASGEYLVVTERKSHSYISHYEKRRAYRCSKYEPRETPYNYCSTQWKRVDNPDYQAPSSSGVISCTGSLRSCLKTQLPRVNRYIYVPDGEICRSGVYTRQVCVAGQTEEYEVPIYRTDNFTDFYVFRFSGDEFHKLDNTLASLDGDDIIITDKPFRLNGIVQKHDHLNFRGNQFYVITNDRETSQLHALTIIGNSAIVTDSQKLRRSTGGSELAASFTQKRIYISESVYSSRLRYNTSELQVFSLKDVLKPELIENVSIPTKLEQLFFSDELLVGVGSSWIGRPGIERNYIGTITGFTRSGQELNSLVLGGDYRYYNSPANYDDQVITFDRNIKRLLFPYQVSQPTADLTAQPEVKRLTISDITADGVAEEHTFSLPEIPSRTLSVASDLALSFSSEYIHSLTKDGAWQSALIFDGEIPDSIYYSRKYPTQVQKTVRPDKLVLKLIDAEEGASGPELDGAETKRIAGNICTRERVYFDQDRILIVQEKPGVYFSYQDCPDRWQDAEILLSGYKIDAANLTVIDDQSELKQLYHLIRWDMHCIVDVTNLDGTRVDALPDDVDALSCYTREQYDELRNEKLQVR